MAGLTTRGKDSSVNLVEWFNWTTFDLISDLTFGESFGCLENGRTHGWIDAIFGNLATLVFVEATRKVHLTPLLFFLIPKICYD